MTIKGSNHFGWLLYLTLTLSRPGMADLRNGGPLPRNDTVKRIYTLTTPVAYPSEEDVAIHPDVKDFSQVNDPLLCNS